MRKTIKAAALLSALILLVGALCLLAARPDLRFTLGELLRPANTAAFPEGISIKEGELGSYSLEALALDDRFEENYELMLVNQEHSVPKDFLPELCGADGEHELDTTAKKAFDELKSDAKEFSGQELRILSGYRSAEKQEQIKSQEGDTAAQTDESEHRIGLAVDVCVPYFAGRAFLKSESGRWVNRNCDDYGFIIRYPVWGEDKTGFSFEPWHLRFVGYPHSEIISETKITLEEYISQLKTGKYYRYENYIITRQSGEEFKLPTDFIDASLSPDNTGAYIFTLKIR